ncbi:MAG: hypothetical protein CEO21_437 [Microgenomates group bacterium Gr01-1014_80]|nr:MAG: hypothetical protein CEO21_437 [Microgenomates group bacterium Gr01-1014_80]
MKVFAESDRTDFAIHRIVNAVKKYAPSGVEFIKTEENADLVILYVYGHRRHIKYHVDRTIEKGKKLAIIQLCIRGTPNPKTEDWIPIWEKVELVWSYYNLPKLCKEDGNAANFNFYYAPLGVDLEVFKETKSKRKFIIAGTGSGNWFSNECKNEVIAAANSLGKNIFQLGNGKNSKTIIYSNGMDDKKLSKYYSRCEFVSGLHRVEGFELPVIEGLLCGARPICFDRPHYRHWFDGLAEFVPEDESVSENIQKLFLKGARAVSDQEKKYVKAHFDWKIVTDGFWKRLKENV